MRLFAFVAFGILILVVTRAAGTPAKPMHTGEKTSEHNTTNSKGTSIIADSLFIAPEIIIEAQRIKPEEELFNRSGFVAMLDLSERRERVEDLSTALSQMVGVHVRQYGGLGSFATTSIRGSSSNQVQIYLDGIPLNDAYTGTTNLADLPLGGIERIEVFRGVTPPRLGSPGIGGAVNLVTLDPSKWDSGKLLSHLEIQESYGSFGTSRHRLSIWSRLWKLKCHLHGGYMESEGDFAFTDDQGTPENLYDDEEAVRINNAFDAWNLLGHAHLDIPRAGSFSLSHNAVLRKQGVPGLGAFQSENARFDRNRHITYLRLEPKPVISRRLHTSAVAFYSAAREQFHDLSGRISLSKQDTDNKITAYGGSGRGKFFVPLIPVTLEVFFEKQKERFHPTSTFPTPTSGPDRLRNSHTLSLAGELYLLKQTLIFSLGERFESHANEFYDEPKLPWLPPSPQGKIRQDRRTPNYGFRWHITSFAVVKGNWGRYFRLPTFLELFGNLGSVTGSAELEPEEGLNRDIGIMFTKDRMGFFRSLFFETVYINNHVDNLILFFPNSQHTSKPSNIGSATIKGWEISFSSFIGDWFHVSGNYTRLDTKDTSEIPYYNGNQLAGRPENEFAILLDWIQRKWKVTYELHYIGANFLKRANFQVVPAREIHNVVIHLETPFRGLSFTAEGRNLAGNRISDINGFPLPGRTFYTTLGYKY